MKISAYSTRHKVYIQNDETTECLARMSGNTYEIMQDSKCVDWVAYPRPPNIKHWNDFKNKIFKYFNFELDDSLIHNTTILKDNS